LKKHIKKFKQKLIMPNFLITFDTSYIPYDVKLGDTYSVNANHFGKAISKISSLTDFSKEDLLEYVKTVEITDKPIIIHIN
jgi:hypothetical protein